MVHATAIEDDVPSKYSFIDDYSEGAHPDILAALLRSNLTQQLSYGNDEFCTEAKDLIRQRLGRNDVAIHFVPSGTAANLISISSCLRPHEAVIAAASGHIIDKEAGAIEATGHKIIQAKAVNGKLTPESIRVAHSQNQMFPHMAKPRLVYISNASEVGTIYTKAELSAIAALCKKLKLLLFMDGARLGVALSARRNDMALTDILDLTDIFWIGGTKMGALLGEAIVIKHAALADDFIFHLKRHGSLLAKGRIMGTQFAELFRSNLYFELASHANQMAQMISENLVALGHELAAETETNQVFAILPLALIAQLQERFGFYTWQDMENGFAVIRLVTSWATDVRQVEKFNACVHQWTMILKNPS